MSTEGWKGWDDYAPFYDWENAQTLGRRDVAFWRRVAVPAAGPVLELGCGTGRVSLPLARAGVDLVGIDRSAPMLARARARALRARSRQALLRASTAVARRSAGASLRLVRGDIRALPFRPAAFAMVLAPYGVLQSLIRPRDLSATLTAAARALRRGGTLGIDLVPDVPRWHEYTNRVQLRGRQGAAQLTLIESVRQDRRRGLTIFEQRYVVRRAGGVTEHQFDLTFRTLSVRQMSAQLERAGLAVDAVLGDYRGRPWDDRADVWIILAKRV